MVTLTWRELGLSLKKACGGLMGGEFRAARPLEASRTYGVSYSEMV